MAARVGSAGLGHCTVILIDRNQRRSRHLTEAEATRIAAKLFKSDPEGAALAGGSSAAAASTAQPFGSGSSFSFGANAHAKARAKITSALAKNGSANVASTAAASLVGSIIESSAGAETRLLCRRGRVARMLRYYHAHRS